ncbi:hypothetical protein HS7_00600 [Sulfolobales archaeon HS-7]|nr:hypothetical protein HS7_00600 [Sulfolobales archaeon HS-7]
MILEDLSLLTSLLAGTTIFLGGIVEGFGYGLSLGTSWPYTRDIHKVAIRGDPEAIHRVLATLVGLFSLVLIITYFSALTIIGFISIVFTAFLGMATLYVLAGKLPSFFQGFHDIAAYTTFLTYMLLFTQAKVNLLAFFTNPVLLSFYAVIFIGGTVTGMRKMKKPIGYFTLPKEGQQIVWTLHGISIIVLLYFALVFGYLYAFLFVILDAGLGMIMYYFINKSPQKPGIYVSLHQFLAICTALTIALYALRII